MQPWAKKNLQKSKRNNYCIWHRKSFLRAKLLFRYSRWIDSLHEIFSDLTDLKIYSYLFHDHFMFCSIYISCFWWRGVGQFGKYLASQFGETAKSVNLANFSEGCQSGDTAKAVNLANLLKGLSNKGDTTHTWPGGEGSPTAAIFCFILPSPQAEVLRPLLRTGKKTPLEKN